MMKGGRREAVYLKRYVLGRPLDADDFETREATAAALTDGAVLLQTLMLSVDPYMRGCMSGLDNYFLRKFDLTEPLHSMGVARVIDSRHPSYEAGDLVVGCVDWATVSVLTQQALADRQVGGGVLRKIETSGESHLSRYLGPLGTTGVTAFFGVLGTARPRRGERMVISGAAGAVGSVAGQIAKIMGAQVVGLAGSPEKRKMLVEQLHFDAALDYRSPSLADDVRDLLPGGPDIYFDNVGGAVSQAVMSTMRRPARVIECGQISSYDHDDGGWTIDIRPIHEHGLRLEGFTPSQFGEFLPGAVAQLAHWLDTGRLVALESRYHGLEAAPSAFLDLFQGGNVGKTVVVTEPGAPHTGIHLLSGVSEETTG